MKTLKRFLCDCDELTIWQVNHPSMEVKLYGIDKFPVLSNHITSLGSSQQQEIRTMLEKQ